MSQIPLPETPRQLVSRGMLGDTPDGFTRFRDLPARVRDDVLKREREMRTEPTIDYGPTEEEKKEQVSLLCRWQIPSLNVYLS